MVEAAINLGVCAELLQTQLSTGDILAANVLPPQGGADLIEMLGLRVAAQLPPGVHPGDTLLLQVTGFAGTQIYVRNLGTPDPRNPLPVIDVVLKAPPESEAAPAPQQMQTAQTQTPQPISPPRAVFVAASVRQAPSPPVQTQIQPHAQTQTQVLQQLAAPVRGVEARIAAAQAARVRPPITQAPAPVPAPRAPAVRVSAVETSAVQTAARAVTRTVQTVGEFLRAARLPDTPFTRMAATIAPHAPERLPSVLQRLEAALPRTAQDARIPTLRTLIGFTARLNPGNSQTLRAQISAYVSNVVQGVESKLTQLLQAHTHARPAAAALAQTQPPQQQQGQEQADAPAPSPTIAQARVAERSAAISHDLKSVVLSLLGDPPAERTPAMTQALTEALVTLTGVQVNAISSNQQSPGTINFTLPVYYHEGGKAAQIRISREGDSRAAKIDADNFHVAFVLDTANLGTVAIDVQTTGRAVKIDVKTENAPAADRFSTTLNSLRARLEDLRYRVASAAASALPAVKPETAPIPRTSKHDGTRGLDLEA